MSHERESIAQTLVADGKGILAADETVPTLTRRFDTLGIQSTEQSRSTYREMLFTAPGAAEFISGVILQDETIRQRVLAAPRSLRSSRTRASFLASKSTLARSRWPALLTRPSPRDSTGSATASLSTMEWAPASRSGARSSISLTLCRAPPA